MNCRYLLGMSVLLALSLPAFSQNADAPVTWSTQVTPMPGTSGERLYRLRFDGRIAPGYVVYGSDFSAQLGPNPTRVRFVADSGVTPQGQLESTGTRKGTDKAFDTEYTYFQDEAELFQVVTIAEATRKIAGTLRGQTCYEADGTCQLFNVSFEIAVP